MQTSLYFSAKSSNSYVQSIFRIRAYLYNLLNDKFNLTLERQRYYTSLLADLKFDSLLDLGCGDGWLLRKLASNGSCALLVGIDLAKGEDINYSHIVSDVRHLPFKDGSFCLITALSVVEHVPLPDRRKLWIELKRVLRIGGKVAVQIPNRYFPIEVHSWLPLFGFLPSLMHSFAYKSARERYTAVPSLRELMKAMQGHGLTVDKVVKLEPLFLPFAKLLKAIGFFRAFPFGYFLFGVKGRDHKRTQGS